MEIERLYMRTIEEYEDLYDYEMHYYKEEENKK